MIRVLLCMTCCNAPSGRPVQARGKNNSSQPSSDEKLLVKNKDDTSRDEQDKLLDNQIQAFNSNYGTKNTKTGAASDIDTIVTNTKSVLAPVTSSPSNETSVSKLLEEDDSITASTSALLQKSRIAASNEEQEYTKYTEMNFDDKSELTPPSSIDIDEFQENVSGRAHRNREVEEDEDEQEEEVENGEAEVEDTKRVTSGEFSAQPSSYEQTFGALYRFNDIGLPTVGGEQRWQDDSRRDDNRLPTSKIGHYARLEYSPIEDFDSITSKSNVSRPNSERYAASGGVFRRRSMTGLNNNEEPLSGTQSQRDGISASVSRRSSRRSSRAGIESNSISISSQLSNEQFQQNLTNLLESATNSPTALFGTIGLPLGPPLDREMETTETRKTSPETTGAALTSNNSQSSLSGGGGENYQAAQQQRSGAATANSGDGGALIGGSDSLERDYANNSLELTKRYSDISKITTSTTKTFESNTATAGGGPESRVESALSMTTTTSGQLTNPTPTPSELSGGTGDGTTKKKSKLRPKNLLKRFKSGKKKNKTDESVAN